MRLDLSPYLAQKFLMPAETEPHSACWMAWPVRAELWRHRLAAAQADFALVARTIARFEPVIMVCRAQDEAAVRAQCGPDVTPFVAPIDDSWMRDSGPTFVRGTKGGLAVVNWAFNAWGHKYHPYAADAALKRHLAEHLGLPLVTCTGNGFAARVSASALAAVGMPELAAASLADYKALALRLVRDPALLASYRGRLDAGRATFPLFDQAGLCRALETAYEKMVDMARAGEKPQAFTVEG